MNIMLWKEDIIYYVFRMLNYKESNIRRDFQAIQIVSTCFLKYIDS